MAAFLKDIESHLNEQQLEAVTYGTGPLLVLAGAGSGKTRVLAYRLAYLLAKERCKPWEVLAVTFTNKAAEEMRERIAALIGPAAENVFMGTFHKTCSTFLRKYGDEIGVPRDFDILDDTGSLILVKRVMRHLGIDTKKEDPRSYANAISGTKVALKTPADYEKEAFDSWSQKVAEVYRLYEAGLENARSLDFDDLIMKAVKLLDAKGSGYDELTGRFRFVLVDEYQDINFSQYRLVKGLSSKHGNLAVVGDDDQSIYGFRGADSSFILNFSKDYPDAAVVKLERNYRSSGNILKCANSVVEQNDSRRRKELWTDAEDGELVYHYMATNEEDEAHYCAGTINDLIKEGKATHNDCAILYRTNFQSRSFEEVFAQLGIPHQIIGGIRFYQRKEIKDIISYLRILNNPYASVALERIINNPTRGIGPKNYLILIQTLTEQEMNIMELAVDEDGLKKLGRFRKRLEPFLAMIRKLYDLREELNVYALTVMVLEKSGYLKRLKDADSIEAESRLENLNELLGAIKRYDEAYPTEGLPAFLEQVSLISDIDRLDRADDSVKIMTCHSAKGLEFDYVFFTGLEEGLLPHSRSMNSSQELEEERRLCYVGITRARSRLFLTWASRRHRFGGVTDQLPSRFLRDFPAEALHSESGDPDEIFGFDPGRLRERGSRRGARMEGWVSKEEEDGPAKRAESIPSRFGLEDRVSHKTFGPGTILEIRDAGGDYFLRIRFDEHGTKLLSESKAPIEPLS